MPSLIEKSHAFVALHEAPGAFVIANAWDVGSAQLLAGIGFKAIATTSAGFARSLGRTDYQAGRDAVIAHCRELCAATSAPVSADLENGFGDAPEDCALTIRLAGEAGLCGGSIEDATGDKARPIYDLGFAVERIAAAAEAGRKHSHRFLLTARAENYLHGRPDLKDTVARLQAFQEAGADVLFAPGLQTAEEVRTVCASVDRPVNVLLGPWKEPKTIEEQAALGVKRISLGSQFHSAAMTGLVKVAESILSAGSFAFGAGLTPGARLDELITKGRA